MDTEARLAIFAIVENNHGLLSKWRPGGIVYANGVVLDMLISSVVGTSFEIERMPLT